MGDVPTAAEIESAVSSDCSIQADLLDTAMPVFRDELFAENSRFCGTKTSPNLRKSRVAFLVFLLVGFENNSPGIRTNVLPGLSVSVKSLTQSPARVLFFLRFRALFGLTEVHADQPDSNWRLELLSRRALV